MLSVTQVQCELIELPLQTQLLDPSVGSCTPCHGGYDGEMKANRVPFGDHYLQGIHDFPA